MASTGFASALGAGFGSILDSVISAAVAALAGALTAVGGAAVTAGVAAGVAVATGGVVTGAGWAADLASADLASVLGFSRLGFSRRSSIFRLRNSFRGRPLLRPELPGGRGCCHRSRADHGGAGCGRGGGRRLLLSCGRSARAGRHATVPVRASAVSRPAKNCADRAGDDAEQRTRQASGLPTGAGTAINAMAARQQTQNQQQSATHHQASAFTGIPQRSP